MQVLPFRVLDTRPAFWVAMFMASAFGANLGDYLADLGARTVSFAVMAVVCLVAVWGDRRDGGEGWYWVGVVALRAAATNAADFVTHDLHVGYLVTALIFGLLTLLAGVVTRAAGPGVGSPLVDWRYWLAMGLAGLFGTLAGDLMSHTTGLFVSSGVLTVVLVAVLVVRARLFPGVLLAYWVAVMAERSAATPVADLIHSRRGLDLGLPAALAITFLLFMVALLVRGAGPRLDPVGGRAPH